MDVVRQLKALCLQPGITRMGRIRTIEGLEDLTSLEDLDLSTNAISDIGTGMSTLVHLRVLSLADNQIR